VNDSNPRARGTLVEALSSALERGGSGLANAPTLLRRILEDDSWRDFVTQRGEAVQHKRFSDFVTTPPLHGLGATMDLIRRVVADDPPTVDLLDQASQNAPSIHRAVDNVNGSEERPTGNAQTAALRRLRKDAPSLHAEVLAGTLSAHAAMVQAGFRPRTVSIPVGRPEAVAATLLKHMAPDDIAEVVQLLIAT
jgi:hypothetical protein